MHYVYFLQSETGPTKRYVGSTTDLKQRMTDHNAGNSVHTASPRPWRLVVYLAFADKGAALAFERYLKVGSGHALA
jgi:putative endonuclease